MISAAAQDIVLNNQKKPAVKKLEHVEDVTWLLKKANMLEPLLENNILESIRTWLEPLPDASLPNIAIQKGLFEVLERVSMININIWGFGQYIAGNIFDVMYTYRRVYIVRSPCLLNSYDDRELVE